MSSKTQFTTVHRMEWEPTMPNAADREAWQPLAQAAVDARDDLRLFIDVLNQAIARNGDPSGVLTRAKELCWIHSDRLHLALNHPVNPDGGRTSSASA